MKPIAMLAAVMCVWASIGLVQSEDNNGKAVTLRSASGEVVVPKGRIWKVEGLRPYEFEKGVGAADLYIYGQVFVGPDRDFTINGQFDISLNRKQVFPVWILENSKVRIGDSRQQLSVKEFVDK
jgi:hypothetical protein